MIQVIRSMLSEAPWLGLLRLFVDVALKAFIICSIAGVATLFLRRSSAYIRNLVWVFAIVGLLALPVFSLMAPVWNLPLIPDLGSWGSGPYLSGIEKEQPEPLAGPPYPYSGRTAEGGYAERDLELSLPVYAWALVVWLAGALLYLLWCLGSQAGVRHLVRRASAASPEWRTAMGKVSERLQISRQIRLMESERIRAAMTVGVFDPVVVVPEDSKSWSDERRCLVLSHELAHVKRWDTLIELVAHAVTVVYWFNPMVWFAVNRLRIERERDCDNAVLCAGAKPSDYAELLMKIAADLGESARPVWQLSTISQGSNLKDRLMSILNPKIDRKRGGRRSAFVTGILVLSIVIPLSASGLWNTQAQEKQEKEKEKQQQTEEMKKKKMMKEKIHEEQIKKKKLSAKEGITESWMKICENEGSAACKVGTVMKKKGIETGVKAFHKMKKAGEEGIYFKESEFNTLGYFFLYHGKTDEAIAVFKLNVDEYPESWNVYDSLGEAYLAAGETEKAEKYYTKALKMNPDADSAKKALEKIKLKLSKKV